MQGAKWETEDGIQKREYKRWEIVDDGKQRTEHERQTTEDERRKKVDNR